MAAAAALALPALLLGFLGSAAAVDLRIAALLPDQNPFYDAMYEMMDMTVREEQGNGILATHNFGLEYTIYEFDQGYLESDINTFANNSVVGFVGPNWSNDTALALSVAVNQSIPVCDGGATAMFSGYPQFFRTIPSDVQAAAGALSFVQSKNWGAAVLITTTDAYGTSMAASYEAARQQSGSPVRVVGPFYFDPVTPFDESLGQMPTVEGTVGCSNIVNAVKSTGVQIVLFAVDAFQMFSCFPHLERAGMLTRDYVYITHDAGTEYYWRFGEADTQRYANSIVMLYPKDQIPGAGLDAFRQTWDSFNEGQYPTLAASRAAGVIPPYLLYVRDCVRMFMRGFDKAIGNDAARADELAKGANGALLRTLDAQSFSFPDVPTATGRLVPATDSTARDYDLAYGWDGAWVPFATWKGGQQFTIAQANRYRDGSTTPPSGGAVPGGGSSSGGLTPLGIGLIVCAVLAVALLAVLGWYLYRLRKLREEQKALVEARQLLVTWSSSPHNTQLVRQLTVNQGGRPNDDDEDGMEESPTSEMQAVPYKSAGDKAAELLGVSSFSAPPAASSSFAAKPAPAPAALDATVAAASFSAPSAPPTPAPIAEPAPAALPDRSVTVSSRVISPPVPPSPAPPPSAAGSRRKKKKKPTPEDAIDSYLDEADYGISPSASTETLAADAEPEPEYTPRLSKRARAQAEALAALQAAEAEADLPRAAEATIPAPTVAAPAPVETAAPMPPAPVPAASVTVPADTVVASSSSSAKPAGDEAAVAAAAVAAAPAPKGGFSKMMTLVTSRGVRKKPVVME